MLDLKENCSLLGKLQPSATLAISAKAKLMKQAGDNICAMTAGEPDFDTPEPIKNACIHAIETGKVKYLASSGLPELKDEIVKKFALNGIKTTAQNIIISTGAKFALFQTITSLCGTGDEVIVFAPYWLSYPEMIKASGATVIEVKTTQENGFQPTRENLAEAITPRTKLIIVNSPNNPTGAVYSRETLLMIADIAIQNNIMVLSDEIYEKLIYDTQFSHISIASLNEEIAERTITVNGFSKAYAMTGWRLGYLSAPEWLTRRIAALQSHATSNATSFVQYAGVSALKGEADHDVREMITAFGKRRNLICRLLKEIPNLRFYEPSGAFYVLCDISQSGLNADEFATRILEKEKLAVIPCSSFGASQHIRLSYACSEENIREAMRRLKIFCERL